MNKSQNTILLDYLKSGRIIDPIKAWSEMGIYRLSARIKDLRDKNIPIETIKKVDPKTKKEFGTYRLSK